MSIIQTESYDTECKLLFSILAFKTPAINQVKDYLEKIDFFFERTRHIYETILQKFNLSGDVPSFQVLKLLIDEDSSIDEKSKPEYADALQKISSSPVLITDIPILLTRIRECSVIRKSTKAFKETFLDPVTRKESVITQLEQTIEELTTQKKRLIKTQNDTIVKFKEDVDQREAYYKQVHDNPNTLGLIKLGFPRFDDSGDVPPLGPGDLYIIQARTNAGKSMQLMGLALYNHTYTNAKVMIITIEMPSKKYATRLDSACSGIFFKDFASGNITQDPNRIALWKQSIKEMAPNNPSEIMIYWVPEDCTPSRVDQLIENNPEHPDLVIVDYAGDMKAGIRNVPEQSALAQGYVYTRLKELAGKHRTVIATAQQIKRGVKQTVQAQTNLEAGSDSSIGEKKADVLAVMYQTDENREHGMMDDVERPVEEWSLYLAKNRNGRKFGLEFLTEYFKMTFREKKLDPKIAQKKVEDYASNVEKEASKSSTHSLPNELDDLEEPLPDALPLISDSEVLKSLESIK